MANIKEIKKRMNVIADISEKLYSNFKEECPDRKDIIDPTMWIINQNAMRVMWENYIINANKMGIFSKFMVENSCNKYLKFM